MNSWSRGPNSRAEFNVHLGCRNEETEKTGSWSQIEATKFPNPNLPKGSSAFYFSVRNFSFVVVSFLVEMIGNVTASVWNQELVVSVSIQLRFRVIFMA